MSIEVEVHAVRYRSVESVNSSIRTSAWLHTRQIQMLLTSPQQEMKSRAFHHSNSSKQLRWGEKPEPYQVEQVWKLFLTCLYDSYLIFDSEILSVDQHVVKYTWFQGGGHFRPSMLKFCKPVHCKISRTRHREKPGQLNYFC